MGRPYDWGYRIAWIVAPPLLFLAVWLVWFCGAAITSGGEWAADQHYRTGVERWLAPGGWNPLHWTGWAYLLLVAWLALGIMATLLDDPHRGLGATVTGQALAIVFCLVMSIVAIAGNGMDEARGYAGTAAAPTTIFLVRDPGHAPSFVRDLTENARTATGGPCDLVGRSAVTGCVGRGDLAARWEPRVVSISAAKYQMKTNSASVANTELRELARGILPTALTRGGLAQAVAALVSSAHIPIGVDVPDERFGPEIEATAYFVIAEALTNIAKHSGAQEAQVRAWIEDGLLRVDVCDDGAGGARPDGSGLLGLHDRVVSLGGHLAIESPSGGGTRIAATLPLQS